MTQLVFKKIISEKSRRQSLLACVVIITIGFGWKYYWISLTVPLVMLNNVLSLFFKRGRFVCGNICPRGAFFDRVLQPFSRTITIPPMLKSYKFRLVILVMLFGFFILQAMQPPYTLEHFGHLFWMMCTVTTILAILLGLFFSYRSWCAFCPVGTILNLAGRDNHQIMLDKNLCVNCKLCEKNCPLNIKITQNHETGKISDRDCIKCLRCVEHCPKGVLK